jgi:opacity protein-like surface antigen
MYQLKKEINMAIKKYAFLSLALLTSMSKAFLGEDSCFKFYAGGDLGMGIFSIDNYQAEAKDQENVVRVQPITYKNSNPVFIGGGRIGLAWTGSECWYAAIEGNIHSASRSSCINGEYDVDPNTDPSLSPEITQVDKTKFIAGVHAHLGYRAVEDGALYAIVGYKYLRTEYSTTLEDGSFETINQCGCINNNGWVVGLGGLWNLECNWDVRLEALYAGFGTKCGTDIFNIKTTGEQPIEFAVTSDYTYRPRLFYGVVSVAYNF